LSHSMNRGPEPTPLAPAYPASAGTGTALAEPHTPKKTPKAFNPDAYRAIVWLVVAITAVAVWFATPQGGSVDSWSSAISTAEMSKAVNDQSAQGAPQQQVVNGWFVADTVPVLSGQASALHTTLNAGRIPSLMLVFGLGWCADVVGRSFGKIRSQRGDAGGAPSSP